jgi:molybdenum cofactor biosynthesis enzyme
MVAFITNKGGTNKSTMEFVISCDYLKIRIDVDISLLDNIIGYLSTNALDFFKLWYTRNHMSQKDSYIAHLHMWDMVKNWAKEKGELECSVVNFVKKFKVPSTSKWS